MYRIIVYYPEHLNEGGNQNSLRRFLDELCSDVRRAIEERFADGFGIWMPYGSTTAGSAIMIRVELSGVDETDVISTFRRIEKALSENKHRDLHGYDSVWVSVLCVDALQGSCSLG